MNHTRAAYTCTPLGCGPKHGHTGGFTLVELMIAIVLAAVLITIAVPSFKHVIASSKLTTTSNSLVSAMNLARMEAVKRNADTQFCSNDSGNNGNGTLGTACATHTAAVYALAGATTSAVAVQVRASTQVSKNQQQLDGNVTALRFTAQGLAHEVGAAGPYTGVVANICTDAIDSDNHRVISMVAGSIIHTDRRDGACP